MIHWVGHLKRKILHTHHHLQGLCLSMFFFSNCKECQCLSTSSSPNDSNVHLLDHSLKQDAQDICPAKASSQDHHRANGALHDVLGPHVTIADGGHRVTAEIEPGGQGMKPAENPWRVAR